MNTTETALYALMTILLIASIWGITWCYIRRDEQNVSSRFPASCVFPELKQIKSIFLNVPIELKLMPKEAQFNISDVLLSS